MMSGLSTVQIAVLFPEVLGTYGDGGNWLALATRLRARNMDVDVLPISPGEPIPLSCDIYLIGGSEDGPQEMVASLLSAAALDRAAEQGAAVVGVCTGMQLLGREFPGRDGHQHAGVGLLPCVTVEPAEGQPRSVGEVLVECTAWDIGEIVGFENHRGQTVLDPEATPLGRCLRGDGNTAWVEPDRRIDGVVQGQVVGTYLHGPVLALNPALADAVLRLALGPLPDVDDPRFDATVETARRRRLA